MIETVAILALFVIVAVVFYRSGKKAGKDEAEAKALEAADEALSREPIALIVAWPIDDPGIDIPRDYKHRGQA